MVLYKNVDGVRIPLTTEEEQEVRAGWVNSQAEQEQAEQEEQARLALVESAADKIAATSLLTADEKQAYFNGTY